MQIRAQSENVTAGIWLGNTSDQSVVFAVNGANDTLHATECRFVDLSGMAPWQIEADPCVVCSFDQSSVLTALFPE